MFSNKDKKKEQEKGKVKPKTIERNIIAKNSTFVGDIISDGDFRIDGILEGSLKTKGRVIIGVEGLVKGNVEATDADIEGKFSGQLYVTNMLTIKVTANITGDVTLSKLSIDPGATFNAKCVMKGAVKELNKENETEKRSEKTA